MGILVLMGADKNGNFVKEDWDNRLALKLTYAPPRKSFYVRANKNRVHAKSAGVYSDEF